MTLEHVPDDPEEVEVVYLDDDADDSEIAAAMAQPDPFEAENEDLRKMSGLSSNSKRKATREIKKVQQSADGEVQSKKVEYDAITGYNFFEVAEPPYNLDYLAKLYEISAPHFAAVNAKVFNIVGLGYEFKETNKTREVLQDLQNEPDRLARARKKVDRAKVSLGEWLDETNEEDSFSEVLQRVWTDVEVMGNGYLEIGRRRNGQIGYIGHIPAQTMRIRLARDGFVQITPTNKVVFFNNFGHADQGNPLTNDSSPNEIIHFKKYSPTDTYYGVPDIMAAKNALAGNEFAARFNLDYFEHKAVPRNIIVLKGAKLSKDSEQKLVEFFQTGLKGKHHRSIYIPLPAQASNNDKVEFKIEKVEADIQDASFIKYLDKNRDEILMAHRVPITKVGVVPGVNLAVARDADKMFKEQVCRPAQESIEKKLRKIFAEQTDIVKFYLKELTLTDEDTMSKIWERRLKTQEVTPNEVREARGWKGLPGGDEVLPVFESKLELAKQQAKDAERLAEKQAELTPTASVRTPQTARDATANRERDSQRSANATDSAGEGRNTKGEGRTT